MSLYRTGYKRTPIMEAQSIIHKYLVTNIAFFQLFVGQQVQSAPSLSDITLSYWSYIRQSPACFAARDAYLYWLAGGGGMSSLNTLNRYT